MSGIEIIPPHRNLGCIGFKWGERYFDITFPPREGWGWSWGGLIRIYWRGRDGLRNWLYLPSFRHHRDRKEFPALTYKV